MTASPEGDGAGRLPWQPQEGRKVVLAGRSHDSGVVSPGPSGRLQALLRPQEPADQPAVRTPRPLLRGPGLLAADAAWRRFPGRAGRLFGVNC